MFAIAKGFIQALLGMESDMPATEAAALDPMTDADAFKVRAQNSLAMAYLLSAFKVQADISLAYETMEDGWTGGLAHKVVEKLLKIYKPSNTITEVELYYKLLEVKMKKKEDPRRCLSCLLPFKIGTTMERARLKRPSLLQWH